MSVLTWGPIHGRNDDTRLGSLALSADDGWLAAGLHDGRILVYALPTRPPRILGGHRAHVMRVTFHEHLLASISVDGTICLWRGPTWELVRCWRHDIPLSARVANLVNPLAAPPACLSFAPDGQTLASTANHTVAAWSLEGAMRWSAEVDGWPHPLAYSSDGSQVVMATRRLRVLSGEELARSIEDEPLDQPGAVRLRHVEGLQAWDAASGAPVQAREAPPVDRPAAIVTALVLPGEAGYLHAVACSRSLTALGFWHHVEVMPSERIGEDIPPAAAHAPPPAAHPRLAGGGHAQQAALFDAVLRGDGLAIRLALTRGATLDGEPPPGHPVQGSPLHLAACAGALEAVQVLTSAGAPVDARGDLHLVAPETSLQSVTPLHLAALFHHADVAAFLIAQGAAPDAREDTLEQTPAHLATLDFLPRIGETDLPHTPLRRRRDEAIHAVLLRAHEHALDARGFTPMRNAVANHHPAAVQALTAPPQGPHAEAVLAVAARGDVGLVRSWLDISPALTHATDLEGHTPLHLAAASGHAEVVALLLSRGADVRAQDAEGALAPIHVAARDGHVDVLRRLLHDHRAWQLRVRDAVGRNALDYARAMGHVEAARVLELWEARPPRP